MKYSRLYRKQNLPAIYLACSGGMTDLFDNAIKETYLITDEEYDILASNMSGYEIDLFISDTLSFNDKKELLKSIARHLDNQ